MALAQQNSSQLGQGTGIQLFYGFSSPSLKHKQSFKAGKGRTLQRRGHNTVTTWHQPCRAGTAGMLQECFQRLPTDPKTGDWQEIPICNPQCQGTAWCSRSRPPQLESLWAKLPTDRPCLSHCLGFKKGGEEETGAGQVDGNGR